MTTASGSPNSVEATTTLLKTELPQLEAHQQALEKELSKVTERLESVRSALTALQALSVVPHVLEQAEAAGTPQDAPAAEEEADEAQDTAEAAAAAVEVPAPRAARGARKPARKRPAAKKGATAPKGRSAAKIPAQATEKDQPSGLTRQVLDVLADADGGTVRARDVAKVLGRDGSPGDINAVRSTLDRLVATSRADRAGRGLYRARS